MTFIDAMWLGKFLGLAESAAELRGRLSDEHFVSELIEIAREYRRSEASSLCRGNTITELEGIVSKRVPQ